MNGNEPTMCDLAEQNEFDKMHDLSRDAKWICKGCGRVANEKNRLCEPIDLYPDNEQVLNNEIGLTTALLKWIVVINHYE